jgi:hypothetical protein
LTEWRRQFYGNPFTLRTFADLGYGVLDGAVVEAAAYVLDSDISLGFDAVFLNELDKKDKQSSLENHLAAIHTGVFSDGIRTIDVRLFDKLPNSIAPHWCATSWLKRFAENWRLKPDVCEAKLGLATGDDFRFLRLTWEVPAQLIRPQQEWTWFVKGGEYEPYYGHIHLLANYANIPFARRATSPEFYGKSGITYTERTTSNLSVRALPAKCVMSYNGPGIYPSQAVSGSCLIGLLNSSPYQFMIEMVVGGGDSSQAGTAARHFMPSLIESLPAIRLSEHAQAILKDNTESLFRLSVLNRSEEVREFFASPLEGSSSGTLKTISQQLFHKYESRVIDAVTLAQEIDSTVAKELGLTTIEVAEVQRQLGRPFPVDSISPNRIPSLKARFDSESLEQDDDTEKHNNRAVAKRCSVIDDLIETIAHGENASVQSIVSLRRSSLPTPMWFTQRIATTVISYLLGSVFGKWDIRHATGENAAPELPDPFAPLPACPPGQLQNAQGLPAVPEDVPATYPVKDIPWDGILVDDPNHPLDIESRVREVIEIVWNGKDGGPAAEAIEVEACEILGVKTLRDYFRKPANFFADHLKRYSKSRRQAPIYWPLSTKSGSYTLWIYYHRLNDQTLHKCLADFLDPKIQDVERELGRLTGKDSSRAADLRDFLNELKDLRDEIERVIKLPWKPNLNDGVLITASPLWKLFRLSKWQKDLKACWEELEKGDYDWAHLAHTIWPERVEKVCEKDRSIAIAHGLEHLCKIEPPKPKKPRGKKASS